MNPRDRFGLSDKVAIVTGASSGLGAAAARGMADAGADIAVVARRGERLDALCQEIRSRDGRCLSVPGDVSDPDTAERVVREAHRHFGQVDVLLNNAGIGTAVPAIRETPEEFRRVHQVNVEGTYWMAQARARAMQPGSSIVNVSSILGFTTAGLPQAAYVSSKAAVVGLTRDLAAQWTGRRGIRVNAVAPGFFDTEMTSQYPDGYLDDMMERVPMGRRGHPGEFVAAVIFLASEASSYVSGVTLAVDGGLLTN